MDGHKLVISRRAEIFLITIILLFFIASIAFGLNKSFFLDEIDVVRSATAIIQKSYPEYYQDESVPSRYGLWHPPLFISLLAISFKVFGVSEASARIVSVIFSLFTVGVIYIICKRFIKPLERSKKVALLSVFLFVTLRVSIQNALQTDIDGSVLTFFTTLLLLAMLNWYRNKTFKWVLASGIVLFLCLLTKETSIISMFALFLFLILRKNIKSHLRGFLLIAFSGIILFLLSFAAYSLIFMPDPTKAFLMPMITNIQLSSESYSGYLGNVLLTLGRLTWYLSYPFTLLFLISLWSNFRASDHEPYSLLMFLWILLFTATFAIIFPRCMIRYFAPSFPPLVILTSKYIVNKIGNLKFSTIFSCSLLFLATFTYLFLLNISDLSYFVRVIRGLFTNKNMFLSLIPCVSPLFARYWPKSWFIQSWLNSRIERERTCILIIVVLAMSYNIYFSYVNLSNPYLLYPELVGIKEAGIYIKQHTAPTDLIIAPKDVAYYAQRRFYEYSWYGHSLNVDQISYMIEHRIVRCFAQIGLPEEELRTILEATGYTLTIVGNVYIYVVI